MVSERTLRRMSNQQLIDRVNQAPDFGWDDECVELCRRRKEKGLRWEIQGNTAIILADNIHAQILP
jgi:hypothetical protein